MSKNIYNLQTRTINKNNPNVLLKKDWVKNKITMKIKK